MWYKSLAYIMLYSVHSWLSILFLLWKIIFLSFLKNTRLFFSLWKKSHLIEVSMRRGENKCLIFHHSHLRFFCFRKKSIKWDRFHLAVHVAKHCIIFQCRCIWKDLSALLFCLLCHDYWRFCFGDLARLKHTSLIYLAGYKRICKFYK